MDKGRDHHIVTIADADEEAIARRTTADAEIKDEKMQLNFDDILRNPAPPIDGRLYNGVLLNGENKMFYWVDPKTDKNCFKIFAGGLTFVNDEWWEKEEQPLIEPEEEDGRDMIEYNKDYDENADFIEIARLEKVCWLQFRGTFDVSKLSSKTWYIVLFEVKLSKEVDKWRGWSTVSVTLPEYMNTRAKHEHKVNMKAQEKEKWIEIPFGVFNTSVITKGEIKFSFIQTGFWISGIEVRGVKIQPLEEMMS